MLSYKHQKPIQLNQPFATGNPGHYYLNNTNPFFGGSSINYYCCHIPQGGISRDIVFPEILFMRVIRPQEKQNLNRRKGMRRLKKPYHLSFQIRMQRTQPLAAIVFKKKVQAAYLELSCVTSDLLLGSGS